METQRFIRYLMFVTFCAIIIRIFLFPSSSLIKLPYHKGTGFYITFPKHGWEKDMLRSTKEEFLKDDYVPEQVVYVTKEKNMMHENPAASISVYSVRMRDAMFIEDEFSSIMENIEKTGSRITDHGQVKLDDRLCYWTLYQEALTGLIKLEFYTVDDTNRFYRLTYATYPDTFGKYRDDFEATKDSMKFTTLNIEGI